MNNRLSRPNDFDLRPDPRILPMLGEINLSQWRCLAELTDNSVDGFLSANRQKNAIVSPQVHVAMPESAASSAKVSVRDNGPGMSPRTLETAVRAGWSGNTPIDSLGIFGMGFNIATARLGTVTSVWTTRREDSEWHGLRIDFEALRKQTHFRTPHLTRSKDDSEEHGTEVIIEQIKPEQRAWLAKTANRYRVSRELSKTYSAMLRENGVPISFELFVNRNPVQPRYPCIWNEDRSVEHPRFGTVNALATIDKTLGDRPFCLACWQWLAAGQDMCSCGQEGGIVQRHRRVHGWLGVQRFLSNSDYGIDFLRNGRKIEISSKDLFIWQSDDENEPEYPIDDPRNRGRIVGEVHLDHCRVNYTKDRFDRNDPAWEEMLEVVRGRGPLRPEKARQLGFHTNNSPLSRLFQCFRRSSPKPKIAGAWAKLLIVKDNVRAEAMSRQFHNGDPEYQDDSKWWSLVEEEDANLLNQESIGGGQGSDTTLDGFTDEENGSESATDAVSDEEGSQTKVNPIRRSQIPSLSNDYRHARTKQDWHVEAWHVLDSDPELNGSEIPWRLKMTASGVSQFFINTDHKAFRSSTLTPLDALLAELAWAAKDFLRGEDEDPPFGLILADLREQYASNTNLDPLTLSREASSALSDLAKALSPDRLDAADGKALFEEFSSAEKEAILQKMVSREVADPQATVAGGRFLRFAPHASLLKFFLRHPELFFDGHYWDMPYAELDYGRPSATERAKAQLVRYYEGLIFDALWLAEQDTGEIAVADRARWLRAMLALELLAPSVSPIES